MSSDFISMIIKDVADVNMGQSPSSKFYNKEKKGLPFLQGRKNFGSIYPFIDTWCTDPKKTAQEGDILISVRAPVGDTNIAHTKVCIGRGLASLRMKNGNNVFLFYLLRYIEPELKNIYESEGTVFGSLNKTGLENHTIIIPEDVRYQKKLASVLYNIDKKIEANFSINTALEALGEALFKRWFVDFEFPDENGLTYRGNGGKMKESSLGEIPEKWSVKNLTDIVNIIFGYPFKSKKFNDNNIGMPIIRIRDLRKNYTGKYTEEGYLIEHLVKSGDLLVGMDAEFRPYVWKGTDALLNQRVCKIYGKENNISNWYLKFLITEPLRSIENYKVATTVIHLLKRDIDGVEIIHPSNEVMERYVSVIKHIGNLMIINYKETMTLSELRNVLLPRLMSGEIRVPVEVD